MVPVSLGWRSRSLATSLVFSWSILEFLQKCYLQFTRRKLLVLSHPLILLKLIRKSKQSVNGSFSLLIWLFIYLHAYPLKPLSRVSLRSARRWNDVRNNVVLLPCSMPKFAEFHCRNDLKLMIFKRRANTVQQSNVLEYRFLCEENVNLSAEFFQHTLLER